MNQTKEGGCVISEFNFKFDKSEFWGGVFELLDKPYIHGFININDPRPNDIRNPFEE